MTLDAVLNKARALEAAATQATKMEKETEQTALAIRHNKPTQDMSKRQDKDNQHKTVGQSKQPIYRRNCSFCGDQFHQRLAAYSARFHQCSAVSIFITSSNSATHLEEKDLTIAAITTAAF